METEQTERVFRAPLSADERKKSEELAKLLPPIEYAPIFPLL